MYHDVNYKLDISISAVAYKHKPNNTDYMRMKFKKEHLSLLEFIEKIAHGYSFCHIYKDNIRRKANFLYSYIICIDVDDYDVPMQDFVNGIETHKPTFAYTTFSNGTDGLYSFRLVYCFDSRIKSEFERLYFAICNDISLTDNKDNCGKVTSQLMNGNSLPNVQVYQSDMIYSITDFLMQENVVLSEEFDIFNPDVSISYDVSTSSSISAINNQTIINDLNTDTKGFIKKYSRSATIIMESELQYNEFGYCLLDDSYLKLFNRIHWSNKKPQIARFKDGEQRRKRIYIDGCIIKKIKPNICFGELLYNLVIRREYYYDNSDGVLSNGLLI